MENQIQTVGDQIEKFCMACNEETGHIIKTMTKQGNISKVLCTGCGATGAFKETSKEKREKVNRALSAKTGEPYDRTKTYRTGQTMMHPTFGIGEVTTVCPSNMIDVLFLDRQRRLIHARV